MGVLPKVGLGELVLLMRVDTAKPEWPTQPGVLMHQPT